MKTYLANKKNRGAALIEVVIASFLFAIGFLSLSNLQIQSFKSSTTAEYRAHASMLALDVIERIRSSKPFVDDFEFGEKRIDVQKLIAKLGEKKKFDNLYDKLTLTNLQNWHKQMDSLLPHGRGCVTFFEKRKAIAVEIMWRDGNEPDDDGYNCEADLEQTENFYRLIGKL